MEAFRKRHLKRLGKLFKKVLRLCQQAGLVKLGNVALELQPIARGASLLVLRQTSRTRRIRGGMKWSALALT